MKSKNIPADIKEKSIKEAQEEITQILAKLEDQETQLEDSTEQYNRVVQLNNYINEQFKKKADEIKKNFKKKIIKKKIKKKE